MKRSAKKCVAGLIALVAGICILPASVPAYTLNHVRVDTDLWYRPNSAFYAGSRDAMRTAMRTWNVYLPEGGRLCFDNTSHSLTSYPSRDGLCRIYKTKSNSLEVW